MVVIMETERIWANLEERRAVITPAEILEKLEDEEDGKKRLEKIQAKLESGKKLSEADLHYLRRKNPLLYAKAVRVQNKRAALEQRLKGASSKKQAQEMYLEEMGNISKDDPDKKWIAAAYEEAYREFKQGDAYKNLPEEERQGEKKAKKEEAVYHEIKLGSYQESFAADGEKRQGFEAKR